MKNVYINDELKEINSLTYETLKNGNKIPEFTLDNVTAVHNYVVGNSSYAVDNSDDFVAKYFRDHKGDVSLSSVITKIILIDTTDSTNLKRLLGGNYYIDLAQRIISSNIEEKIAKGEDVNEEFEYIAKAPVSKDKSKSGYMNLFVFVSKYVTRVNQYSYGRNDYSILDSVVREYLPLYSGVPSKEIIHLKDNYKYDEYCDIFSGMLERLGSGATRVMIDHFVWFSHKQPTI